MLNSLQNKETKLEGFHSIGIYYDATRTEFTLFCSRALLIFPHYQIIYFHYNDKSVFVFAKMIVNCQFSLTKKAEICSRFDVIGVASRSLSSVTPRDEENAAAKSDIF